MALNINGKKIPEIIRQKLSLCKVEMFKSNIKIEKLNPFVLLIF